MANVINKAINKFGKGLVMDFSPENTGNEVLTNALNATLLTFNGNELSLQNDMGNARVETAFLPEGYIPVGICEYGGIIYIVSYNPLEDKSLIGCFPSPERNISSDEIGTLNQTITYKDFQEENENGNINGNIKHLSKYVLLKEDNLNPGDKFIILTGENIYGEKLQDLYIDNKLVKNPILKISVVSIEDSGKITYLDSTLRQYEKTTHLGNCKYHILGSDKTDDEITKPDIDAYRNVLSSGYNVFKSKTSGKLALLAELITIDSYSVTHSIIPNKDNDTFNIVIHTEVSPMPEQPINLDNLSKSSPSVPSVPSNPPEYVEKFKSNYYQTPKLKYYYLEKSQGTLTYDTREINFYTDSGELNSVFYNTKLNELYTIKDFDKESDEESVINLDKTIGADGAIINIPVKNTYHGNNNSYLISYDSLQYNNVELGFVKIPQTSLKLGQPFPFIYEYTLIPCMEYGKLNNLKVSNKIDFSKIRDFSKSKFNAWRYHIDGNQLKLTFGAEVYDLDCDKKVIGLHLDFYDQNDFVGSLSIDDENRSYSGEFTRILSLDTLNVLNNVRINNNHSEIVNKKTFTRNVNIINNGDGTYSYLGRPCKKVGNSWNYEYSTTVKPPTENLIRGGSTSTESYNESRTIESDGFMLQSNLIYGVKAYFKIQDESGNIYYEYNRPFVLFTFPIYNDKYYSKKDFSALQPDLKLALTYTLNDESERYIYDDGNIIEGYSKDDKYKIDIYLNGTYSETNLSATKYYNHEGITKLKLQCGLKKEYENIGFWIDPEDLNNKCQFNLRLMGNTEDNNFYYESDISDLNYGSNTITNSLTFKDGEISLINQSLNTEFEIKYNFITGYKFNISDIRTTEVPATTFCALCHKKDEYSDYNYEDFGIYVSNTKYLSDNFLYNTGDSTTAYMGVCYQKNNDFIMQANSVKGVYNEISTNNTLQDWTNKLHLSLFKELNPNIGKLTFCMPHGHLHFNRYGANVKKYNNEFYLSRTNAYKNELYGDDITGGINGYSDLFNEARFSMCPVTESFLNQSSKFYSVIDSIKTSDSISVPLIYHEEDGTEINVAVNWCKNFKSFNPNELSKFNEYLINTMKSVYVYNPDYNTLKIKVGDVKLQEYNTKFISNILSSNFELTDESKFNNYIKFGPNSNNPFIMSDYINNLKNHLDLDKLDLDKFDYDFKEIFNTSLTFKPDYTYCGKSDPSYLITTLNYNIPSPKTLEDELSFKGNNIIIKHNDTTINIFTCNEIPNKNLLYGIDDNNNLVLLNVGNYKISNTGILSVIKNDNKYNQIIYSNSNNYYNWEDEGGGHGNYFYSILDSYKDNCLAYSSITLSDLIYNPFSKHRLYLRDHYKACLYDTSTRLYYRLNDYHNDDCNYDRRDKNYTQLYNGPGYSLKYNK